MTAHDSAPRLRRVLGLRDLVLFFVTTGTNLQWVASAAAAGPSSLVVWVAGALLMFLPLSVCVLDLASRHPDEGGLYVWTQRAFGPFAGFMTGWAYWTSNLPYFPGLLYFTAGNALLALGERGAALSGSRAYFVTASLLGLALATALNVRGLEVGKWLNNVGAVTRWLATFVLLALGALAWVRLGPATSFAPAALLPGFGTRELIFFSAIAFAWTGPEAASFMGGEIQHPRRTLPRALALAAPMIAAIYLLGTLSVLVAVPAAEVSGLQGVMQAVARAEERLGLSGVTPLAALLITVTCLGSVGAWLEAVARLPFVAGLDRYLPPAFSRLHPRWGSPHVALLTQAAVAAVFVLLGQAGTTVQGAYGVLLSMTFLVTFIPFVLLFAAAIKLQAAPAPPDGFRVPGGRGTVVVLAAVGLLTTVVSMGLTLLPPPDEPNKPLAVAKVAGLTALLLLAGMGLYVRGRTRVRAARAAALVVCACAGATGGCRDAPPPAPPTARHVVLVTIDTLRADRVGVYGGPAGVTPNLDRIAREGAFARRASAHVPLTRPSHATMFTGVLPWQHGVRDNISPGALPGAPLLAEVLKARGFETAAFVSSVVLAPHAGFGRGFDHYSDEMAAPAGARFLNTLQRRGDQTLAEAVRWLEASHGRGRMFLWLHLYDPHDPYEPPEPFAARFAGRPYDGEVAFADALVGQLDDALGRLGLRESTLLVATSDHGEGLGEHGETLHGFFVYQTTLAVPLIVRGPGVRAAASWAGPAGLVDLYPTVLDLAGVAVPPDAHPHGRSWSAVLRGGEEPPAAPLYAESLVPLLHFGWSDLRVLREGRWKYVQAPRPELFDLEADPGEATNLAAAEPARAAAFQAALGRVLDQERRAAAAPGASVPVDLLEKLGALGYVGGAAPAQTNTPGADPKDHIADFRVANTLMREGLVRLNERDFAGSAARFEGLLRRGIVSFEAHFYLGRALLGLGRTAEAERHLEEAVARAPGLADGWLTLAQVRVARGRKKEARAAYEKALPLAPRDALVRLRLGELLRDLGENEPAVARLRESVEIDPSNATAWNSLGMTLGGNGRLREAEDAFREAVRRNDANHRYAFNLGLILSRQGRPAEARPYFEQALRLQPGFTPARDQLARMP